MATEVLDTYPPIPTPTEETLMRWPWSRPLPQPCQVITVGENDVLVFDEELLAALYPGPTWPKDEPLPLERELRAAFPTQQLFFVHKGVLVKQVIQ